MPTTRSTLDCTREELGRAGQIWVDFTLHFDAHPGEKMVMYYRDGSGYPGSPPTIELTEVEVTAMGREDDTEIRPGHPEWFELLDRIVRTAVQDEWDSYLEDCVEQMNEAEEYTGD
tara:strand:+ start:17565 stop:17912 length:348 start_codon:yes stop_codon:yes gene_type:complete